jgi:hypothetical protein
VFQVSSHVRIEVRVQFPPHTHTMLQWQLKNIAYINVALTIPTALTTNVYILCIYVSSTFVFWYIIKLTNIDFLQKIDKIPPVCNVTSSPVSCGSDPCKCTQTNVYITADIWDEGDGLDEITAPNTPTNSLQLNRFNKGLVKAVGIVRATLMYAMFFNCH